MAQPQNPSPSSPYHHYMVEPVYGIPVPVIHTVTIPERERSSGQFGRVRRFGSCVFRCLFPCFQSLFPCFQI